MKWPGRVRRLHSFFNLLGDLASDSIHHDGHEVFQASTVTYASLSGKRTLADRGFAPELSEASCTSGGAEVLTEGALSLRVRARLASLTTTATVLSPQMAPI